MAILALIQREIRGHLRRVKTLVVLVGMCCFIGLFMLDIWPNTVQDSWVSIGYRAKGYISLVLGVCFAGSLLFVPGLAAPTLVIERETNSWDMLSLTLLGPWGIIIGKLWSILSAFLLMVVGLLPFLAAIFFLVGIDFTQVLICLYILVLTSVTCASLGMLASAYNNTTTRAISRSYVLTILNLGLGYLLIYWLWIFLYLAYTQDITGLSRTGFEMSPAYSTIAMISMSIANISSPVFSGTDYMLNHTVMQLITIAVSLLLTWVRIRRPVRPPVAKKKGGVGGRMIPGEPLPLPPGFKPVPDGMNPILFREIHWGVDIKKKVYIGFALVIGLIAAALLYSHLQFDLEMQVILYTIISVNLGLFSLFSVSNFANIFTKDDELKNIDMLKMTLVTSRDIVSGKIGAGIRVVNRIVLLSFFLTVGFLNPWFDHAESYWDYGDSFYTVVAGHGTLWMCGVLCVQIAAFASAMCKRTTTAVVMAFAIAGMLYFGFFIGLMMMSFGGFPEELIVFTSPLFGLYLIPQVNGFKEMPYLFWTIHTALYCGVSYFLYQMTQARYAANRYNELVQEN